MANNKKVKYMTEAELEKYYPGLARGEIYNYDKKKVKYMNEAELEKYYPGLARGEIYNYDKKKKY